MTFVIRRRRRRRLLVSVVIAAASLSVLAGSFRAFVVSGPSDAPTLLVGDRVLVNRMAYDLFVPFTEIRLLSWADPQRGDIVMCRFPGAGDGHPWLKRVVGIPDDTVELRDSRLIVNGEEMGYEILVRSTYAHVPPENHLGEVVALETGAGMEHEVTFTPGVISPPGAFGPARVEQGHYFVLGDSRGNSLDSRTLGPVPRDRIIGKYALTFLRVN